MTGVRVFAQTDVRDRDDVWRGLHGRPDRLLDDPVFVVRPLSERILVRRQTEKDHGRETEGRELLGLRDGFINRQPGDPRHRRNRGIGARILSDEDWLHEMARIDRRLADERPKGWGPSESSETRTGTREVSHGLGPPRRSR